MLPQTFSLAVHLENWAGPEKATGIKENALLNDLKAHTNLPRTRKKRLTQQACSVAIRGRHIGHHTFLTFPPGSQCALQWPFRCAESLNPLQLRILIPWVTASPGWGCRCAHTLREFCLLFPLTANPTTHLIFFPHPPRAFQTSAHHAAASRSSFIMHPPHICGWHQLFPYEAGLSSPTSEESRHGPPFYAGGMKAHTPMPAKNPTADSAGQRCTTRHAVQ